MVRVLSFHGKDLELAREFGLSFFCFCFLNFNWQITTLQYRVGLCHTSRICPLSFKPPSHLPSHHTPLGCHRASDLSSLRHTANSH